MKTVTFAGDSRIEVKDVPAPELQLGEVLVKVGASAICGSEMKRYRSPDPLSGNPGHEMVGEVVESRSETGPGVGDRVAVNIITGCGECVTCRAGDRRFCDQQGYVFNGHAEYVVAPAVNCMPLPNDVPFDDGVLIGGDTLGVAFHALSKICLRPRDTVAVVGCGPVGLGFVRLLSFYGVRTIAAEVSAYRQELARRLGAERVVDPSTGDGLEAIRDAVSGRGVDVGIDASGTDAGVNLALDATRDEGTFIFAGAGHTATINPWSQFLEKELVAYGVWYFVDRDYFGLLDLYWQGLTVSELITHRFPLEEAPTAYSPFDQGETGKSALHPKRGDTLMAETMIPLGCSTLGFRFDSLDVALAEIAAQGFHLVDIAMYPSYCPHFNPLTAGQAESDALQARLHEHGMTVAALNATDGLLGIPEQREHALAYARASLQLAQRLGAYGLTMQSGVEPEPGRWLDVARVVAPDLRQLGDFAADLGLELTLELHKTLLMATGQQALDLMALVDHPAVGVALDPSHATYAGEDVAEIARNLGDRVKHVHLRDGRGQDIMVVPGDGTVDFSALASALQEIGYRRTAVIELEYERALAPEVRPDLARAKTFLERAFGAI